MLSRPVGPVVPRAWFVAAAVCALRFAGLSGVLSLQLRVVRPAVPELRALRRAQALPRIGDIVPDRWLRAVWARRDAIDGEARRDSLRSDSLFVGAPPPGRALILVAIAHDCAVCTATMDTLVALAARRDAAVAWRWLSRSPADSIARYAARFSVQEPVALLPDDRTTRQYGIRGTPTYVVVDAVGRVRYATFGGLTRATARDSLLAIAAALARDTATDGARSPTAPVPETLEVPP